jgi:hypothetical protein
MVWVISSSPGFGQEYEMFSNIRLDPKNPAYLPDEILVKFKDQVVINIDKTDNRLKTNIISIDQALESIECQDIEKVFRTSSREKNPSMTLNHGLVREIPALYNIFRFKLKKGQKISGILSLLKNLPEVEWAEPNYIIYAIDFYPDDLIYQAGAQWHIDSVRAPAAWDLTSSDTNQVIGILDTGVEWDHPDLAANTWTNWDEIPSNDVDDDENGFVDDFKGWDFINEDNDPMDDNGHGTHVAGIAGAVTNNSIGVAGIAWGAQLMAVKMLQSTGNGNAADFAEAIHYAMENGATVINMSVGSYGESYSVKSALEYAYSYSSLVASAGNDFYNLDLAPMFPACYSFVLGVESSDFNNEMAFFTNFDIDGPIESVYPDLYNYEVRAPGLAIYSTFRDDSYHAFSGTSMSAPIVSGNAAMMRSYYPGLSNEKVFVRMIQGADNGIVNIYNNLTFTPIPHLSFTSISVIDTLPGCDQDGIIDAGETIQIAISVRNCGGYADSVWAKLCLGYYEDTTVAEIQDSISLIGDISEYASMNNHASLFKVHIPSYVAHNREIVFKLNSSAANADTIQKNFIINVQNAEELAGVMDTLMTLTPDKLWVINKSFRVGINGILRLMPGTTLEIKKRFVNRGRIEGYGTPDSIINICGPEAIEGGYYEFHYTYFNQTLVTKGDSSVENIKYIGTRLIHCKCFGAGPWYLSVAYHCSFINGGMGQHPDSVMYCNFESNSYGNGYFRPDKYMAYNNFIGQGDFRYEGNIVPQKIGSNNIAVNQVGYFFECPDQQIPPLYYGTTDTVWIDQHIKDFEETQEWCQQADFTPIMTVPTPLAHGMVWKIHINGVNPQEVDLDPVGAERVRFDVYFNRAMDTLYEPKLYFGVRSPYNQHLVSDSASWSPDSLVWTAYYDVQLETGDGMNYLRVQDAKDPEDFDIPVENTKRFGFLIQAAGSQSIPFTAQPGIGRCILTWAEANSVDVLGYNLYRYSSSADTTRLNEGYILLDTSYTDFEVKAGTSYHYLYKVVGTDFNESDFSRVIECTPIPAEEGDANGDSLINVLDISTVTSFISLQNPLPFLHDAADINNDEQIDVLDVVGIVNIILEEKNLFFNKKNDPLIPVGKDTGNEIIIQNSGGMPGDSVTIRVEISNSEPFISFQFDVLLPDSVYYIDNSLELSDRSANHVIMGNMVDDHLLRVISYSPDNSLFIGDSGMIATFRLKIGNITGEFNLVPEDAVIGNQNSQNILTGTQGGILSVHPQGIGYYPMSDQQTNCYLYPNPYSGSFWMHLELDSRAKVSIDLLNAMGGNLSHTCTGLLEAGSYDLKIIDGRDGSLPSAMVFVAVKLNYINSTIQPNQLIFKLIRK